MVPIKDFLLSNFRYIVPSISNFIETIPNKVLGQGEYRKVFALSDDLILKVPTCFDGIVSNVTEFLFINTKKGKDFKQNLAKCNLKSISGIPCIIMERLNVPIVDNHFSSDLRKLGLAVDSCTQSVIKNDLHVCYDYGNEHIDMEVTEYDNFLIGKALTEQLSIEKLNIPAVHNELFLKLIKKPLDLSSSTIKISTTKA